MTTLISLHPMLTQAAARLAPDANVITLSKPSSASLARAAKKSDGILTLLSTPIPEDVLKSAPFLRVVGTMSAGLDHIDLAACKRHGVAVVHTPRVLTRATAELTLALLLAVARRLPEGEALCRKGRFKGWVPDMLQGLELKGRRALVVGRGPIGREVARLYKALGLRAQILPRHPSHATVLNALKRAQVLSLHLPLTSETHHWLNARRICALPRDAIVINAARGPVVDEKALITALKARAVFGAGFDVYEREPEIPKPLRRLPNVVLLPHLGSATIETRARMAEMTVQGVLTELAGRKAPNRVKL